MYATNFCNYHALCDMIKSLLVVFSMLRHLVWTTSVTGGCPCVMAQLVVTGKLCWVQLHL
jgi:hypothetical protein